MSNDKTRGWDAWQVKTFVQDAISQHRAVWDVVPTIRRAIIAQKFTTIVTGQDRGEIPTVYLDNLWADMCVVARTLGMTD